MKSLLPVLVFATSLYCAAAAQADVPPSPVATPLQTAQGDLQRAPVPPPASRLEFDYTTVGFSSNHNAYGPWQFENLRYNVRWPESGDVLYLEASHQADGDAVYPTHGNYFAVGETHNFTPQLYGNFNVGYGTSNPYARDDLHFEMNGKLGDRGQVVMGVGYDLVGYYSGQMTQRILAGPVYYYQGGDVSARWLEQANSGARTQSGAYFTWDAMPTSRSKYTVTALLGPQQYLSMVPGLPLALANYNGQTYTIATEQQIGNANRAGATWGLRAGGFLSVLNYAVSGEPLYVARGLTVGAWSAF